MAEAAPDLHRLGLGSAIPAAGSYSICVRPSTPTCELTSTLPTSKEYLAEPDGWWVLLKSQFSHFQELIIY